MKKNILFITLSILSLPFFNSCGTLTVAEAPPEQREYTRVVEFPGVSKNDIYIKTNEWFVRTFNSADSVIEFQDKESGKIIGKYTFDHADGIYVYRVKSTISIDIKEEKMRVVLNDPYFYMPGVGTTGTYGTTPKWIPLKRQDVITKTRIEWSHLMDNLSSAIKEDSNW